MKWFSNLLGGRKMSALDVGTRAPQFELPEMNGSTFSLEDALTRGPVLAVFLKVSCPVCQYALPYFERIFKAYGSNRLSVVAVSQNEKKDTATFISKYGLTFPVLLDNPGRFPVSNAYGLTNVPTAFWIAEDGEIEISSVGWMKQEFEEIARKAASASGATAVPLFQPGENVADFRAG